MPEVAYIGQAAIQARAIAALTGAVTKAAYALQGDCQAQTPVETGTLKASIHVEGPDVGAMSVEAKVATGGESSTYAIAVHEGIAPRTITPTNKQALYWPGAAHPVKSVNHPGFAGRKYIERPLLAARPQLLAFIQAAGREAF